LRQREPDGPSGGSERCNGIDDDCDGITDGGTDVDGDGRAGPCDCDESDPAVYFGGPDPCDGVDGNCDGAIDDRSDPSTVAVRWLDEIPTSSKRFGSRTVGLGDHDGDGLDDFADEQYWTNRFAVFSGATGAPLFPLDSLIGVTTLAGIDDLDGDGVPEIAATEWGSSGTPPIPKGFSVLRGIDGTRIRRCDVGDTDGLHWGNEILAVHDLNGDGIREVAIAAKRFEGVTNSRPGAIEIVSPVDCTILRRIEDPFARWDDSIAQELALASDLDRDGIPELAASGRRTAQASYSAGFVTYFSLRDGTVVRRVGDGRAAERTMGCELTAVGDQDGDGHDDLVVAECGKPIVHLLRGRDGAVVRSCRVAEPTASDSDYGHPALASLQDSDGDGVREIAVLPVALNRAAGVVLLS
jgi:Protein metal binding site.